MCIFDETKECDGCMECEVCDLDPSKPCFVSIKIDKVITDPKEYKE